MFLRSREIILLSVRYMGICGEELRVRGRCVSTVRDRPRDSVNIWWPYFIRPTYVKYGSSARPCIVALTSRGHGSHEPSGARVTTTVRVLLGNGHIGNSDGGAKSITFGGGLRSPQPRPVQWLP